MTGLSLTVLSLGGKVLPCSLLPTLLGAAAKLRPDWVGAEMVLRVGAANWALALDAYGPRALALAPPPTFPPPGRDAERCACVEEEVWAWWEAC